MPEPTRYEWEAGYKMAAQLIMRHPELLQHAPPLNDVLFVYDREQMPTKDGRRVFARVSKIPAKFEDFVYEGGKVFMLEWFAANVEGLSLNQQQVLMVHELLHFEYNEVKQVHQLRGHDFEDFQVLMDRFGYRWSDLRFGDVPDIMAEDFSWGRQGQSRLRFDAPEDQTVRKTPAQLAALAGELVDKFGLQGAKELVAIIRRRPEARSLLSMVADNLEDIVEGVAASVPGVEVTVSAGSKQATAKMPVDPDALEVHTKQFNVLPLRPTGTSGEGGHQ